VQSVSVSDKDRNDHVSDLSATPNALTFASAGVSATFVVSADSGHEISATVADPSCASVSPAEQKPKRVGREDRHDRDGRNGRDDRDDHTATFTVTSVNAAGCSTTVTVVANHRNTATVTVTIVAPTPAPTTTTGAGGTPTGI
jgi:hypothetical protein